MRQIKLDKKKAEFVKKLRVEHGLGYRSVHRKFQIKFVDKSEWYVNERFLKKGIKTPHGNIIVGTKLCLASMKYLNENWNT